MTQMEVRFDGREWRSGGRQGKATATATAVNSKLEVAQLKLTAYGVDLYNSEAGGPHSMQPPPLMELARAFFEAPFL